LALAEFEAATFPSSDVMTEDEDDAPVLAVSMHILVGTVTNNEYTTTTSTVLLLLLLLVVVVVVVVVVT